MIRLDLPYINAQRDRGGRVRYWYFRRRGKRVRLPSEPLSAEFMHAYHRLVAETEPEAPADRNVILPGTFGALVRDYLASPEFREKAASTKGTYRRVLNALAAEHGTKRVAHLERRHIRAMRDARADTPGAANTLVRMLKLLMSFAVEHDYRSDNPAARLKLFKGGEWRSWTDTECAAFEARWPSGTMQRRAYVLAVYTGLRRSDLVALTRGHREAGGIRVVTAKTGEELWIPEHPALTVEIAGARHLSLLTTSRDRAFDPTYFGAWFADAIEAAGLPEDCVLHGLRKAAARRLADAGCTEEEIKAITGHRTAAMVARYTKAADKRQRATAAILKLEKGRMR